MTAWFGALPVLVVAGLVCGLPGWVAGRLLGLRGLPLLGLAGPLGVAVTGVGAVVTELVGLSWTLPVVALTVGVGWVLAALVGLLLRRAPAAVSGGDADGRRLTAWGWVASALGLVAVSVPAMWGMGRPDGLPNQPDTLFHLNTIRLVLETGDGSSLHAGALHSPAGTGFYPAAFHDLVTVVVRLTGTDVLTAANAVALVAAAAIWPTGCVLLARQVHGAARLPLVVSALVAASFSSFPFWMMGYGVLWPNLLGYAMVPAALACALAVLGLGDAMGRVRGLVAGSAVLAGTALAHPNALVAALLLAFVVLAWPLAAWVRRSGRAHPVLASLAVLGYAAVPAFWAVGPYLTPVLASVAAPNVYREMTPARAVGEALLASPRSWPAQWTVSVLVVAGLVVLLRQRRARWTAPVLGVLVGLYVVSVSYPGKLGGAITGYWYNNPPRLAALLPIIGVVLATAALVAATRRLQRTRLGRRGWPAALAVGLVVAVLTSGNYLADNAQRVRDYYQPTKRTDSLLTAREARSLEELARSIPRDGVVAADPWNGTSLLYALTGREVLFASEKTRITPDRILLADRLDEAATDPAVCAAAERADVRYVVTGGSPFHEDRHGSRTFDGVDGVPDATGFERVTAVGPFTLYRLLPCRTSG